MGKSYKNHALEYPEEDYCVILTRNNLKSDKKEKYLYSSVITDIVSKEKKTTFFAPDKQITEMMIDEYDTGSTFYLNSEMDIHSWTFYTYNDFDRVAVETEYNEDLVLISKTIYKYDEQSNLIEQKYISFEQDENSIPLNEHKETEELDETIELEYDTEGKIVSVVHKNNRRLFISEKIFSEGAIETTIFFDAEGKQTQKFVRNNSGVNRRTIEYDKDDKILAITEFKYNEMEQLLEERIYNSNREIQNKLNTNIEMTRKFHPGITYCSFREISSKLFFTNTFTKMRSIYIRSI